MRSIAFAACGILLALAAEEPTPAAKKAPHEHEIRVVVFSDAEHTAPVERADVKLRTDNGSSFTKKTGPEGVATFRVPGEAKSAKIRAEKDELVRQIDVEVKSSPQTHMITLR
jgi:hypothetical protein